MGFYAALKEKFLPRANKIQWFIENDLNLATKLP